MSEYNDRVDLYIDPTNTDTWVKAGDALNFEPGQWTLDESTVKYVSGGRAVHVPGENSDVSAFKFTLSYDPNYVTDLLTYAAAQTELHLKFDLRNGRAFIGHFFIKSHKSGSVSGDKTNAATMDFEIQGVGDEDWAAGTAVAGNWYDRVTMLTVQDSDFALGVAATKTLAVYAIYGNGNSLLCDNSLLTWNSSDATKATCVGGLTTGVGAGSTYIKVSVTGKVAVNTTVKCTVS